MYYYSYMPKENKLNIKFLENYNEKIARFTYLNLSYTGDKQELVKTCNANPLTTYQSVSGIINQYYENYFEIHERETTATYLKRVHRATIDNYFKFFLGNIINAVYSEDINTNIETDPGDVLQRFINNCNLENESLKDVSRVIAEHNQFSDVVILVNNFEAGAKIVKSVEKDRNYPFLEIFKEPQIVNYEIKDGQLNKLILTGTEKKITGKFENVEYVQFFYYIDEFVVERYESPITNIKDFTYKSNISAEFISRTEHNLGRVPAHFFPALDRYTWENIADAQRQICNWESDTDEKITNNAFEYLAMHVSTLRSIKQQKDSMNAKTRDGLSVLPYDKSIPALISSNIDNINKIDDKIKSKINSIKFSIGFETNDSSSLFGQSSKVAEFSRKTLEARLKQIADINQNICKLILSDYMLYIDNYESDEFIKFPNLFNVQTLQERLDAVDTAMNLYSGRSETFQQRLLKDAVSLINPDMEVEYPDELELITAEIEASTSEAESKINLDDLD